MEVNTARGLTVSCPAGRSPSAPASASGSRSGFTLLEVVIACAIFCMVGFSVLEMVVQSLAAARALQIKEPDPGMLAATLSLTNRLEEGTASGDFEDLCPGQFPDYTWSRDIYEVSSNGLFQVDFVVYRDARGKGPAERKLSILLYRPASPPGRVSKGGL